MVTKAQKKARYRKLGAKRYFNWLCDKFGIDLPEPKSEMRRRDIERIIESHAEDPRYIPPQEAAKIDFADSAHNHPHEIIPPKPEPEPEPEPEPQPIIEQPFVANVIDYSSMTVRELQAICKERGLTIRGTKAQVVLRLKRDDEGIVEEDTAESETEAPSEEAADVELDAPSEEAATIGDENDADSEQGEYTNEEE